MPSYAKQYRRVVGIRRGLTFVEFVGCLAALGGGGRVGLVVSGR